MLIKKICFPVILLWVSATVSGSPLPVKTFTLNAAQRATMGLQLVKIQPHQQGGLLVAATVTTPPDRQRVVSAPYDGYVNQLAVGVGDNIHVGDKLVLFTSSHISNIRSSLLQAKLAAQYAQIAWNKDQQLFADGIISEMRLRASRQKAGVAQSILTALQADMASNGISATAEPTGASAPASSWLTSPVQGVLLEAPGTLGQRVEAGTPIIKLADSSTLSLEINIPVSQARDVNIGDEVMVSERLAQARVIAVSRAVNATQAAKIRALVTVRGNLHMGELVLATVQTRLHAAPGTLWRIPSRALVHSAGRMVIFAEMPDRKIAMYAVKLVSNDDDVATIEAYLQPDTRVVVAGIALLKGLAGLS